MNATTSGPGTASGRDATPTLAGRDLRRVFGHGDTAVAALAGIDIEVHAGELTVVTGPSGSGKTTLLNLLGGLDQAAERGAGEAIAVSALTGEGLDRLRLALDERLSAGMVVTDVAVEPADGATVAWLYQNGEVLAREDGEDAIHLRVRLSQADLGRFETRQEP